MIRPLASVVMPELPEVEILRRNMDRWFTGRSVDAVEILDPALVTRSERAVALGLCADLGDLVGHRLVRAVRRAKWLVLDFEPLALVAHFRMTGKLVRTAVDVEAAARPRARLRIDVGSGAECSIWFQDTRRLGRLVVHAPLHAPQGAGEWLDERGIGPEPWPEPLPGAELVARARERLARARKPRPVRDLLLEERFVAGVGNITACEALWQARIHPGTAAQTLAGEAWGAIARAICDHVNRTLAAEDGDEVHYVNEPGTGGSPSQPAPFRVYGRAGEPCPRCPGERLESGRHAGRSWVFCPRCQPRDAG